MKVKNARTAPLFLPGVAALSAPELQCAAEDDGGGAQYGAKAQAFDPEKRYGKIPDDVLLDRDDAEWTAQKLDGPEFERKQDAARPHAAYDLEKNGWNEAMMRTVLVTHNFDVMSGEAGNGFELVALAKALDRMQGAYSATEPEKRFHDWVASRYEVPDNAGDIDARIDEIKSELGPDLVSQTVAAFDEQARHGNVPGDLIANDTAFWAITAAIAMCDHDPDCDSTFMRKVRDEKIYEREAPDWDPMTVTATAHPILEYLLPTAHAAWMTAEHTTSITVRVPDCDYEACTMSIYDTCTGVYSINLRPPEIRTSSGEEVIGHATGATVPLVEVVSCAARSNPSVYNYVLARFDITTTLVDGRDGRLGCAFVSESDIPVSDNSRASWTWSLTGSTNAFIRPR